MRSIDIIAAHFKGMKAGMTDPRISGLVVSLVLGLILFLSMMLEAAPEKIQLCHFNRITGLPCPSCGMTRAFISLGHGDLSRAFFLNPASPFLYSAVCIGLFLALLQIVTRRRYIEIFWTTQKKKLFPFIIAAMACTWDSTLSNIFMVYSTMV